MSEADRQDTDRAKIVGELQGEVMVYQPMTIMEVSHGGAQIKTAFPIQLGSLHDVRLTLCDLGRGQGACRPRPGDRGRTAIGRLQFRY